MKTMETGKALQAGPVREQPHVVLVQERWSRECSPRHAGRPRSRPPAGALSVCFVISLLLLPLAGCGYSLAGRGSFLPADIKVIGVPLFKNHTNLFEFERRVTDKVRSELIGRGKYRVEPTADNVDAILVGEINSVYLAPAAFNEQRQATRYVLTLSANIEFRSVKDNKVLWANPSMQFRDEFDVTTTVQATDAAVFLGQDANALERLSIEFARAIISSILEAF